MTKVMLPKKRSSIVNTPEGIEIIIPTKKNWFIILFLGFWMVGWLLGEVSILTQVFSPTSGVKLFLIACLGGWTISGFFAGFIWFWTFLGKEHINLRPDALITKREVFGIGPTREYDITSIVNLRIAPLHFNPFDFSSSLQFWGLGGGLIAFDYGAKTFRCGNGVDESEASEIINQLRTRYNFKNNAG